MTITITSSILERDLLQVDGRRVVREAHTDDQGQEYIFNYMADISMDVQQRLTDRAAELEAALNATPEEGGE